MAFLKIVIDICVVISELTNFWPNIDEEVSFNLISLLMAKIS